MSTVRQARLDEINVFYEMYEHYLKEYQKAANTTLDPVKAMNKGGQLFQAYVGGSLPGNCHFWCDDSETPQGFFLSGEQLSPIDMFDELEDCWTVWAVYINPEYRQGNAGRELAYWAAVRDAERGVKRGITVVRAGNDRGASLSKRVGSDLIDMRYSFVLQDVITRYKNG